MTDGRMLIHESGVRWKFDPTQPRQHGKWSGPSALPAQIQAAAHAAYEKAHPELPHKPWVSPPDPQGRKGGKAGGYTAVGITNTELGDKVEDALQHHLGMQNEHPGKRQGPLDLRFDGHGYEVKAVSSLADEYKAKPKASEVASKKAYAAEHGLSPHTMIVVYHPGEKQLYAYSKPGIGAYRLTNEANGWKFHGTIPLDLGDTSPEPELEHAPEELRLGPKEKSTLDTVVREHLKVHPTASAAAVKQRMKFLGYKVEGEPGGYTYNHILEATKRIKAETVTAAPAPKLSPPDLSPHPQAPLAPKGLVPETPGVPPSWEPAPLSEDEAYENAAVRGIGYQQARAEQQRHASYTADQGHQAHAAGLSRYIDEREAKHQKLVEARRDALRPPTEGWKHLTPDQVHAYYAGTFKHFGPTTEEQRLVDEARHTRISLYQDGSKIVYKMLMSPTHAEELRKQVVKARRLYPGKDPLNVVVGRPAIGRRFPNNVLGQTYTGTGNMFLSPKVFSPGTNNVVAHDALSGHFIPAAKGKSAIEVVFSHELGHTLDSENGFGHSSNTAGLTKDALSDYENMSGYGRTKQAEAYAEAFAEWHMSNGKTKNPVAQLMAEEEHWATDKRSAPALAHARASRLWALAALSVEGTVPA